MIIMSKFKDNNGRYKDCKQDNFYVRELVRQLGLTSGEKFWIQGSTKIKSNW